MSAVMKMIDEREKKKAKAERNQVMRQAIFKV